MRRSIAIALLLLIAAGSLAPAAMASISASTPACCRASGPHHCMAGIDDGSVKLRSQSCPYRKPLMFSGSASPRPAVQPQAPDSVHPFLQEFYPEFFATGNEQRHTPRGPPAASSSR